ncbi:autotransporter-associated beta strand repeat-containing protein, partial [bacterium]|nr:autotransporter-associated beta strand repeat-containing protein [bacterium]
MRSNLVNPSVGVDMAVTKSGSNTWQLVGTNTYTGGTTIANGTLIVSTTGGAIPQAVDPTKGLIVNGSWQNAGQLLAYSAAAIAAGNEVTINGNGWLQRSWLPPYLRLRFGHRPRQPRRAHHRCRRPLRHLVQRHHSAVHRRSRRLRCHRERHQRCAHLGRRLCRPRSAPRHDRPPGCRRLGWRYYQERQWCARIPCPECL